MSTHDADESMSRRAFVGAATGGAALSAAGGAAAQEEQEGTSSGSGSGGGATKEVLVGPGGNLVFEPADLEITPGTTVKFVWESDNHNVVVDSQPDGANWEGTAGGEGQTYNTGHEYSHTFDTEGTYEYYCAPHLSAGMEGSITVSADAGGGGPSRPTLPDSALTMGVTTIGVMASTLALAFFFLKYGGDYEGAQ
jgi:plastocyanin